MTEQLPAESEIGDEQVETINVEAKVLDVRDGWVALESVMQEVPHKNWYPLSGITDAQLNWLKYAAANRYSSKMTMRREPKRAAGYEIISVGLVDGISTPLPEFNDSVEAVRIHKFMSEPEPPLQQEDMRLIRVKQEDGSVETFFQIANDHDEETHRKLAAKVGTRVLAVAKLSEKVDELIQDELDHRARELVIKDLEWLLEQTYHGGGIDHWRENLIERITTLKFVQEGR